MKTTFSNVLNFFKKLLFASLIIGFIQILWNRCSVSAYNSQNINDYSHIDYPSEYNYKQISTYCGPFSTAAVTRVVTGKQIDSFAFSEDIGWKILDKGTHPIGLKKQLKKQGIAIEVARLRRLSDDERLQFLQERLSQGKPIILLGEKNAYQHYVTLLGFNRNKEEFYVYDSWYQEGDKGLVVDENDSLPGNLTLSPEELIVFWEKGGMYSFYKWYALVASPKDSK